MNTLQTNNMQIMATLIGFSSLILYGH